MGPVTVIFVMEEIELQFKVVHHVGDIGIFDSRPPKALAFVLDFGKGQFGTLL